MYSSLRGGGGDYILRFSGPKIATLLLLYLTFVLSPSFVSTLFSLPLPSCCRATCLRTLICGKFRFEGKSIL